jgi:IS5 family transposase
LTSFAATGGTATHQVRIRAVGTQHLAPMPRRLLSINCAGENCRLRGVPSPLYRIRKLAVTHAAVADTTVFETLLDPANTSSDVYAYRGYPSAEREQNLTKAGWRVHIQRKGTAQRGISDTQKQRNRRIATPRARVEHVFGALAQMGGKLVRCMGIVRTTLSLHLKAAAYNLKRLVFLKESGLKPF